MYIAVESWLAKVVWILSDLYRPFQNLVVRLRTQMKYMINSFTMVDVKCQYRDAHACGDKNRHSIVPQLNGFSARLTSMLLFLDDVCNKPRIKVHIPSINS